MRFFTASLLIAALLVSAASAELLVTASPLGQGKWALSGAYISDANVMNNSSYSMSTIGCYAAYGLTDQLDLFLNAGSSNVGGLPAGISVSATVLGLNGKYTLISEGGALPVSVALGAGYKTLNITQSAGLGGNATGSQIMVGVGVSKIIAPFCPYAGLSYRSNAQGGSTTSTQLDLTLGGAVAWSMQGAVLVEYTLQSITPNGGSNYSSGQYAASVAYTL